MRQLSAVSSCAPPTVTVSSTQNKLLPRGDQNHFLICQGVSRTAYASALAACNACSEHRANGCAVSSCAEARVPAASILSKNVSEVCTTKRSKKTRVCGASQHAADEHRPVGGMIYAYLCAREHPGFSLRGCVECHGCEYPSLSLHTSFFLPDEEFKMDVAVVVSLMQTTPQNTDIAQFSGSAVTTGS